ncbi:adenylyltransferase/cytidyltransferase family protein [bacterium]|nr:adenylyltransferase/cytidyltransferase family protein [bacterium]
MKNRGLVTGTFDLLHEGHVNFVKQALKECRELVIGVESDERVKQRKGKGRPINRQEKRKAQLKKIFPETQVVILPNDFGKEQVRRDFLDFYQIETLFTTQDDPFVENKRQLMLEREGEVKMVPKNEAISTTQILESGAGVEKIIFAEDRQKMSKWRQE